MGNVLSSIVQRSRTTSVFRLPCPAGLPSPVSEEFKASRTSHLLPLSSTITRLWPCVRLDASRYVSMTIGGGWLSKLPQVFHINKSSRKSSISSVSIWNCGRVLAKGHYDAFHSVRWPTHLLISFPLGPNRGLHSIRDCIIRLAHFKWKFWDMSAAMLRRADDVEATCMIWSSFRIESLVGPPALTPIASKVGTSCPEVSEPARQRALVPRASLGLLVRVGLVWGEVAGDDTRGGCLGCWCIMDGQKLGFCRLESLLMPASTDRRRENDTSRIFEVVRRDSSPFRFVGRSAEIRSRSQPPRSVPSFQLKRNAIEGSSGL